eukprot:CAMPEP_0119321054 /NCGR_PEP_ID=MMETSP1333-20130426/54290_1 /TAXON_ID=418940 /ORGANISM="Scyphosphaera apsteinii, Strain RCC1455" /LENGTH=119 /DNA_ID=CAMNT_0007327923 /DNA_START=20 /DNA_END=379 /DNA_ORIENTATION=+
MAKKVDVSFMKMIDSQEAWTSSILQNEGQLIVVDVYSSAWGACNMLANHFCNLYFDLAEKRGLAFARAESDQIKGLKEYRDSAKPVFLFYLNGEEKAKVEGPDMPKILDLIYELAPVTS